MKKLTLKELAIPLINSIDSFNYLLKSHHRRTAIISYEIGKKIGLNNDEMINLVIAAALHDIGALSVQERDMLIQQDVEFPEPHCKMGYKMLSTFDVFTTIAQILKHHHIKYNDLPNYPKGEVPYQSQIIHLADRVDVLTHTDIFILNQKEAIRDAIVLHSGTTFNPALVDVFLEISKSDIFWININNMTMEELFKKIQFTLDYELTIDDVVEFSWTISRIIDFRSRFTASHSATVAQLAAYIGKLLDFNEVTCKKLKVAGYLHDIGKIGLDPAIIDKNGPLTGEEYNQIKLHPYYTEQILKDLNNNEWFHDIIEWSKYHHENIKGTGYPYMVTLTEKNIGSLIISYADIMSALTETRPYREALDIDVALDIIKKQNAEKLSCRLCDVITAHKDEIREIISKCQFISYELYLRLES